MSQPAPRTEPSARVCPACRRTYDANTKFCTEDGTPLQDAPPNDPLMNQVLMDRWEVLDRIGTGGFAKIYKVRDVETDRIMALKTFDRRRVSANDLDEAVARFRLEARLLRGLGALSPYILSVDELLDDTQSGVMYLPMELVTGESLADVVRREGTFPADRMIPVLRQVCEALEVAHTFEEGVVHRDLSLDNIMLTEEGGQVRILDFGIAKAIGEDEGLTNLTMGGPGTPAYAAPEQVEGREVDQRTDLFTLGVVIYAMLTRHEPWLGGDITGSIEAGWKMLRQTVDGDPIPVSQHNPDANPGLVQIAMKLLEKKPDDRFQSARAVREALDAVARGEEPMAHRSVSRDRLRVVHARSGVGIRIRRGRFFPKTVDEGATPWEGEDLKPGSYRVEVVDPRYEKEVRKFKVVPGQDMEIVLTAQKV